MNTKHRSCNPVLSNSLHTNKLCRRRRERDKFTLVKKRKEKNKIHLKKDWFPNLPKQLPGFCPEALWTGKVCLRFYQEFPPFLFGFRALLVLRDWEQPWKVHWKIWEQLTSCICACDTQINFSVGVFQDGGQEEAKERKEGPCVWWKFTQVFSFPFIAFRRSTFPPFST